MPLSCSTISRVYLSLDTLVAGVASVSVGMCFLLFERKEIGTNPRGQHAKKSQNPTEAFATQAKPDCAYRAV